MSNKKTVVILSILVFTLLFYSNSLVVGKDFRKINKHEDLLQNSQNNPSLQYNSHFVDDDSLGNSYGNGDGFPETGETIELQIILENSGNETATGVYVYLSTSDPLINIWDNYETYPEIPNGSRGTFIDYEFDIDPNHGPSKITFNLEIYSNEGHWTDSFSIQIFIGIIEDDAYEENDYYYEAYNLSNYKEIYLSSIEGAGIQGDDDWYEISINSGYESLIVDLIFTHAHGDIDIQVYDSNGTQLITLSQTSTDNEYIDYILPSSGIYYLRVYGVDVGNSYDLWWNNELAIPPDNGSMIPGYNFIILFSSISVISAIMMGKCMYKKTKM